MAMGFLLASSVSLMNSSGRVALLSIMSSSLSSLSERRSMWMGEGRPGSEELGELGSEGAAGGADRLKYYIWIRSPEGIADCKQELLEKVENDQKGE